MSQGEITWGADTDAQDCVEWDSAWDQIETLAQQERAEYEREMWEVMERVLAGRTTPDDVNALMRALGLDARDRQGPVLLNART